MASLCNVVHLSKAELGVDTHGEWEYDYYDEDGDATAYGCLELGAALVRKVDLLAEEIELRHEIIDLLLHVQKI